MGISPLGFQNHIQNPLAAVMYAVMNGAFDNAKDARRTDYQLGQDRQQQQNRELDQALQVAMQGGQIPESMLNDNPVLRGAAWVGGEKNYERGEVARDRAARMKMDEEGLAIRTREQNRIAAESAQRMKLNLSAEKRAAENDATGRAATWSSIGNTWADNVGAVGKFLFGGGSRASRNVQTVQDGNGGIYEIVQGPNGAQKRMIPTEGQASPGVVVPPAGPSQDTGSAVTPAQPRTTPMGRTPVIDDVNYPSPEWKAAKINNGGLRDWMVLVERSSAIPKKFGPVLAENLAALQRSNPAGYALVSAEIRKARSATRTP